MNKNEETNGMKELVEKLGSSLVPLKKGSTIEVIVTKLSRSRIYVNVGDLCYGIIPEKEFSTEFLNLKVGDKILAYLLDLENDEGYAVFSLKRADRERVWHNLNEKMDSGETVKVKVLEVNRGGLIVQYGSIEGFLPMSQLSMKYHHQGAYNSQEMNANLRLMIDKILNVKIINLEKSSNKLIFSEKEVSQANKKEMIKEVYKVGQKISGKITGIVPFGLFVDLGESEGLIHISEISWDRVADINKHFKIGDAVESEVIDLENGKVSLSLKRLIPDPWLKKVDTYHEKDIVKGTVIRITPFGAFVELENKINGLVHISELSGQKDSEKVQKPEDVLEIGKDYNFLILNIEPDTHKINLALEKETPKQEKKKSKKNK